MSHSISSTRSIFYILFTTVFLFVGTTAHAAPELSVRIDGVTISDDHTHNISDTAVGELTQIIVVLRNIGNEDLLFLNDPPVVIADDIHASHYSLIQPALEVGMKLSPNASTAYAIRFVPQFLDGNSTSPYTIETLIRTNDANSPFNLFASGTAFNDCNNNATDDLSDIAEGVSEDCNQSTIPDECEELVDTDEDGSPDVCEFCSEDPFKNDPGVCGCGFADEDLDGDEIADCIDICPDDFNKVLPGVCGCGEDDVDVDNDGTIDCFDSCIDDPLKDNPGVCGCGTADTDTDADLYPDCIDTCPLNPDKVIPGVCGCGTADLDENENGVIDCSAEADFLTSSARLLRLIRKTDFNAALSALTTRSERATELLASLSTNLSAVDITSSEQLRVQRFIEKLGTQLPKIFQGRRKQQKRAKRRSIRLIVKLQKLA